MLKWIISWNTINYSIVNNDNTGLDAYKKKRFINILFDMLMTEVLTILYLKFLHNIFNH